MVIETILVLLLGLLMGQSASGGQAGSPSAAGPHAAGVPGGARGGGGGVNPASSFQDSKASGQRIDMGSGQPPAVMRQGKQIGAAIADNFDAMVAAAKRDGVDLKIESGYRSRAEQAALYQKYLNGTGNLAAKPGTSNHEKGNAIDFANTPGAFDWLKKNAARFGLHNLPGEAWHYSTNGH